MSFFFTVIKIIFFLLLLTDKKAVFWHLDCWFDEKKEETYKLGQASFYFLEAAKDTVLCHLCYKLFSQYVHQKRNKNTKYDLLPNKSCGVGWKFIPFLTASSLTHPKELLRHHFCQQAIYQIWSILRHIMSYYIILGHIISYYIMSDMKWYDCINWHHKGLGQVKISSRKEKKE